MIIRVKILLFDVKLLIPLEELEKKRWDDLVPCECERCKKTFFVVPNKIKRAMRGTNNAKFCSRDCRNKSLRERATKMVNCSQCGKPFLSINSRIKEHKNLFCSVDCANKFQTNPIECKCEQCGKTYFTKLSKFIRHKHHFCTKSCAGVHNIVYKKFRKRSKLEEYIGVKLKQIYPNLYIEFNNRKMLKLELDIYIPSLKLAIELNGPTHYKPIHGMEILYKQQMNDARKFIKCLDLDIKIEIINVSNLKTALERDMKHYLDIVTHYINQRLPQ